VPRLPRAVGWRRAGEARLVKVIRVVGRFRAEEGVLGRVPPASRQVEAADKGGQVGDAWRVMRGGGGVAGGGGGGGGESTMTVFWCCAGG